MDDLEFIKMRLSRVPKSDLYKLSQECGVAYGTLWHLKTRGTKAPRYPTVRKLADFFQKSEPAKNGKCRFEDTCVHSPVRK